MGTFKIIATIAGLLLIAILLGWPFAYHRYTYTYTCEICSESWAHRTSYYFVVPIWRSNTEHTAVDHRPVYHGGGYSHSGWGWVGCGNHRQTSP